MKSFLLALLFALSALSWAGDAQAARPAGHRFCDQGAPHAEMIRKIEASLATDPSGNRRLEGCRATPQHLLTSYRKIVAQYGIAVKLDTVADLPNFFRSMRKIEASSDAMYNTDCLWTVRGGIDEVRSDCEQRFLEEGEEVYGFEVDGSFVVVYYSGCANPGSGEIAIVVTAQRCVEVHAPTTFQGQPVRGAYIGPRPLPGYCHELHIAGMSEPFTDYPEECADTYQAMRGGRQVTIVCDWRDVVANSRRIMQQNVDVQNVSFSFKARAAGTTVWVLPVEALEGLPTLCWEMPDGSLRTLSVGRDSFVDGVATITVEHLETIRW